MKVAQHAKRQTERSMDALYSYTAVPRQLAQARQVTAALHALARPLYWRLNADHTISPLGGADGEATLEWARQFEQFDNRVLKQETIEGCLVSTVFLGLDHGFGGGPPLVFETMAFSAATKMVKTFGDREREIHEELTQRRYSTYDEAMRGHAEVAAHVRATVAQLDALKGKGE